MLSPSRRRRHAGFLSRWGKFWIYKMQPHPTVSSESHSQSVNRLAPLPLLLWKPQSWRRRWKRCPKPLLTITLPMAAWKTQGTLWWSELSPLCSTSLSGPLWTGQSAAAATPGGSWAGCCVKRRPQGSWRQSRWLTCWRTLFKQLFTSIKRTSGSASLRWSAQSLSRCLLSWTLCWRPECRTSSTGCHDDSVWPPHCYPPTVWLPPTPPTLPLLP